MSTAEWLALLGAAFSGGGIVVWTRLQVKRALRMAHRAHQRIDDLEAQTGSFTTLREKP